jgi:mono/diheme cytochrome c family protein
MRDGLAWRWLVVALVLMIVPSLAWAGTPLGARIYGERCSACHGTDGAGDGPAAAALDPKPRNFRDRHFWRARPRTQVRLVVEHGRPGTMMAGFKGVLTPEEIDAVVSYVMDFEAAAEGDGDASPGDGQVPATGNGEDPPGAGTGS